MAVKSLMSNIKMDEKLLLILQTGKPLEYITSSIFELTYLYPNDFINEITSISNKISCNFDCKCQTYKSSSLVHQYILAGRFKHLQSSGNIM